MNWKAGVYDFVDANLSKIGKVDEKVGRYSDTFSARTKPSKVARLEVGTEVCKVMDTAITWIAVTILGIQLYVQVEDCRDDDVDHVYGSYVELQRS